MKMLFTLLLTSLSLMSTSLRQSDDVEGAWQATFSEDGQNITVSIIFSGGYIATATYQTDPAQFISTWGGSYRMNGKSIEVGFEFNTADTTKIGKKETLFTLENGVLKSTLGSNLLFSKIDDGKPGMLTNAYLITGRKRDDEIRRSTPGARKTMKILSGTRFQWIAYNTETGGFFGTGGGTYTTEDGNYTENIEFFSRDYSRTGASLQFQYGLEDGEWHHQGLSSKGDPIYEIWTPRNMLN